MGICAEGAILANTADRFKTNWPNSYFKSQDCVSVVDLVNNTRPRVTKAKLACDYAIYEQHQPVSVFLILSASVYSRAITWEKWKKDKAYGQQIVPCLESGVPDRVPIEEIEEAWFINLKDHDPPTHFLMPRNPIWRP